VLLLFSPPPLPLLFSSKIWTPRRAEKKEDLRARFRALRRLPSFSPFPPFFPLFFPPFSPCADPGGFPGRAAAALRRKLSHHGLAGQLFSFFSSFFPPSGVKAARLRKIEGIRGPKFENLPFPFSSSPFLPLSLSVKNCESECRQRGTHVPALSPPFPFFSLSPFPVAKKAGQFLDRAAEAGFLFFFPSPPLPSFFFSFSGYRFHGKAERACRAKEARPFSFPLFFPPLSPPLRRQNRRSMPPIVETSSPFFLLPPFFLPFPSRSKEQPDSCSRGRRGRGETLPSPPSPSFSSPSLLFFFSRTW